MNGLRDLPDSVNRAIFLAVALYFALIGYGVFTNDPLAVYAAEFVFGAIAIGVGTILFLESDRTPSAVLAAAVCLVLGGALQFAFLFSRLAVLDDASSLVVFVGVGLYIYAVFKE